MELKDEQRLDLMRLVDGELPDQGADDYYSSLRGFQHDYK